MAFETPDSAFAAPTETPAPEAPLQGTPPSGTVPSGTPEQPSPEEWDIPGVGRVARDELIKGYLRQNDYSRKTMALSQKQREYERIAQENQAMEATLQQVHTFLQNRAEVEKYLKSLAPAAPEVQPGAMLTTEEAQALMQRRIGETEQAFSKRLQEGQQETMKLIYQMQYEGVINGKLQELGTKYPELTRVPGMEMLLREAVRGQKPGTIDDALPLFDQAAAFYASRLKELVKPIVSQPNNPLNRGIEPPSSGAPGPTTDPTDFRGIKDPALRDLVVKDIERLLANSGG